MFFTPFSMKGCWRGFSPLPLSLSLVHKPFKEFCPFIHSQYTFMINVIHPRDFN